MNFELNILDLKKVPQRGLKVKCLYVGTYYNLQFFLYTGRLKGLLLSQTPKALA